MAATLIDGEADSLGDCRCQAGPSNTQMEAKDQKRIQGNVENGAGCYADHGQECISLMTHLVVHCEAAHDEQRTQQNKPEIILGVGEYRVRRAEETEQGFHEDEPDPGNQGPGKERREESDGSHFLGLFGLPAAQSPGDIITGSLPEIKGDGLNERHIGENDAEGRHGRSIDLSDKESIRQIIDAGDQHADHRRNSQRGNESSHRRRGHLYILLFLKVCAHILQMYAIIHAFDNNQT